MEMLLLRLMPILQTKTKRLTGRDLRVETGLLNASQPATDRRKTRTRGINPDLPPRTLKECGDLAHSPPEDEDLPLEQEAAGLLFERGPDLLDADLL